MSSQKMPYDIQQQVVMPKQKDFTVVAMTNSLFHSDSIDEEYDRRISGHINRLNQQESVLARDKNSLSNKIQELMQKKEVMTYDGQKTHRLFHSLNNRRGQESLDLFGEFYGQSSNYYVMDIETFGDTQERNKPFGISEISLNEYDKDGNLVKKGYNGFLNQNKDVVEHLQGRLQELKADKYIYNSMEGWEKRSLVDLMRYASHKEKGDSHTFSYNRHKQEVKHHSIIESVFNHKDQVDDAKVLKYMDDYLVYMQSGLDHLASKGSKPKATMKKVLEMMAKDPEKFTLTYNGNQFDMPVLQAFAKKMDVEIPGNIKHLDYLNVIKTAFMDSDDLKRMVNPEYERSEFGKDKLAAFRTILPDEASQKDAHNAQVDTNDTAKVVATTRNHVHTQLTKSNKAVREGFNLYPTEMSWADEPLKHGQTLFASSGVQAFKEGEESFRAKLNEDGKWMADSNGFNKTVISSKSFYQFAGHEEMGDGKLAFRFFNPETKELSYIIREANAKTGETAFQQLQSFAQGRFYNWDNVNGKTQQEIRHLAETDRARRRYDRFFSMDGGGKGLAVIDGEVTEKGTAGFSGLKRMMTNAQVMKDHLESNGEYYRNEVDRLIGEGLTKNKAQKQARKIRSHELMSQLKFNSLWDPETKSYTFNEAEKDQFFKMHQRLIDEMPYMNEAINKIDSNFSGEIAQAALEKNFTIRNDKLKKVNQKRDRALTGYYQAVINEVGVPEQKATLKHFETHRLSYFDPEVNDSRSINFETAESARNNLYSYAKRGIDNPNENQHLMKERMDNLLKNLHSQKKITGTQLQNYTGLLWNTDRVFPATQEIALDMRLKSGLKYDQERMDPSMIGNKNIQTLNEVLKRKNMSHEHLINQAIQDTQNATMIMHVNEVKGKKLELSKEMQKTLDILDVQRFSGLNPNNYQAIENVMTSIHKADSSKHVAMVMDKANNANLKMYVYDKNHSIQVHNQLARGGLPAQALEINMPLISESGTHKIGSMVLNAHSMAVYDKGNIKMISSAEHIAQGYVDKMGYIMKAFNKGNSDKANYLAKQTLRDQTENMSGIQRNMEFTGENDSMAWANNQSDHLKQSHVKVANAMIEDMYYSKDGYDGLKLTEKDFYDPEDVFIERNGKKVLRPGVTLDSVNMETTHKMLMKMPKWSEEKLGMPLFTSSLKAEHVSKGVMSMEDVRQLMPFGSFYNHGRDNAVQYMNAHLINDETEARLKDINGVSRSNLLKTRRQLQYEKGRPNKVSVNMKTAFMSQDQLTGRINEMFQTDDGRKLLGEVGLLTEHGELNQLKLPRLYEQQGILAKDVVDALEVDNEKRYTKGKQFEVASGLEKGSEIKPGQFLGTRTHDNGHKEKVYYEGNKKANLISGATGSDDLLLQWKSDPFKLMLDGEKMTDSPVDRRFIQVVTGQDDVVAIINPDVAKHKDFGMLMSGESRLMAEEINKLDDAAKAQAIDIIHKSKIGLKWSKRMNGFLDDSFDKKKKVAKKISKEGFDDAFAQLRDAGIDISNTTAKGVRVGILEAHMSKVSNYSKVTDETGNRVIDYSEGYNAATGEYEVRRTYAGADGVQWGHREMGVLRGRGMEKTYQHVFEMMKEKTKRLGEVEGLTQSLQYMTEQHAEIEALSTADFEKLPELHRNKNTYKGTIFGFEDKESMIEKFGNRAAIEERGFWLDLPGVKRKDGRGLSQVTTNLDGEKKAIDKIFIPFTATGGANGDIHLRDLQKHISKIYQNADAVNRATSIEDARAAQEKLQSSVTGYMKHSFKELTSSQGMMFDDVFKVAMGGTHGTRKAPVSSASGLFKLMDLETSKKYGDGQFTVVSEDMAKKMGVYDHLANGKNLHVANVRYPTFHDGAMQFSQLRMSKDVKDGEIHTTSFASMLQNADSDGDYSHLAVIDNDEIQAEWKQAHDETENKYKDRWNKHVEKELGQSQLSHNLKNANVGEEILSQVGNSDEQMAAKIGKMTIGRASNLNLSIRQIANRHFSDDSDMNYKMKQFGEGLEQKLIDAKHGAKPAGLDMINAIYSGKWDEAMQIDNDYFDGMFQGKFHMKDVAEHLPIALSSTQAGLQSKGLKFGTGTGITYKSDGSFGVQQLLDLLHGNADIKDFAGDNEALMMWHKFLKDDRGVEMTLGSENVTKPIERLTETSTVGKINNGRRNITNKIRNGLGDVIGGTIPNLGEKIGQTWDSLKGMSSKKKLIAGGALAVAGIAGYNILNTEKPEMHYNTGDSSSGSQESAPRKQPQPAIQMDMNDYATQNASISVSTRGRGADEDQLSLAVSQGMRDSGMNTGPTRMSINKQDNTQQLNRLWYRDKVRDNI